MTHDQLHDQAVAAGEPSYRDPRSGYRVFTSTYLASRGECCGSGCRHCPFGHQAVPPGRRTGLAQPFVAERATWSSAPCDVLSWSGGKDSFLALRALQREAARAVVLLSTFDGRTGRVAHQDVTIDDLRQQARALGLPLILVPLAPSAEHVDRVVAALRCVQRDRTVHRLVYGDLHLRHIRAWREQVVGSAALALGVALAFPLWDAPYEHLIADLRASGARVTLSAVPDPRVAAVARVGDAFDQQLLDRLPRDVDAMGERGEFHTLVAPRVAADALSGS